MKLFEIVLELVVLWLGKGFGLFGALVGGLLVVEVGAVFGFFVGCVFG